MTFLGKNLKYLRKQKGWSQEELAVALGVKRSSIAAYESKDVEPRLRVIFHAADLLGVSFEEIVLSPFWEEQTNGKDLQKADYSIDTFFSFNPYENEELKAFAAQVSRLRKVLNGFRLLLDYKKETASGESEKTRHEILEIENVLFLLKALLQSDEAFLQSVHNRSQL
jgi:transcriptional regulator with XRE-family HTH domain